MKLAYFVNQYPKVSHTFIRREIEAIERLGHPVDRFALRGWDAQLVSAVDLDERDRTRYVLRQPAHRLAATALGVLSSRPRQALSALRLAMCMARRADRPWPVHIAYWIEACTLLRWFQSNRTTHVHAHFGTNSAEVVMLASAMGGPTYSFTVHGPDEFDRPEMLHLASKAHGAAFVVAISSFGRSQLLRWLSVSDWEKVKVIHCGLEKAFFAPSERREGDGSPRLVNVGRLCAAKGQLLLVDAAARLAGEGIDFELVLAGDGEMRDDIDRAIRRLGLERRVRVTGWLSSDAVRDELLAARALVMPSFAEGLPVVIMEAMAVARPVIATRIAGIPELVCDGITGWLVNPGDLEDLAAAMRECLAADPARLAALGSAGRDRVAERHNVDVEASKLVRLCLASKSDLAPRPGSA